MPKLYMLRCDYCSWRRVTDGKNVSDLYEVSTPLVALGFPKYDEEEKKMIEPLHKEQRKRFRCPGCGRTLVVRDYMEVKEDENRTDGN